ncbi:MAG: cell envelope biogenesis protein OmpA [Vicingaceae bacterium]
MSESKKLEELKKLLLDEDRASHQEVVVKLEELTQLINTRKQLEAKVNPIIDSKIDLFQESIPEKLGPSITKALKTQIAQAQDDIVEVLAPIIGKMIKKFVVLEMQILSEKIDVQLKKTFSIKGWVKRIKSWFGGIKESDLIIRELSPPQLEEIFVIEKGSGLLKGSYSKHETIDKDMISGMLTAIKSFVEDAFTKGSEELEMIEYESYKIQIYNYNTFFIAIVVSGVLTAEFKSKLQDTVLNFLQTFILNKKQVKNNKHQSFVNRKLGEHFERFEA